MSNLRGNCKSPPFVIQNEVMYLKRIDINRFHPLVEMTVDAFFDFCKDLSFIYFCCIYQLYRRKNLINKTLAANKFVHIRMINRLYMS